MDFERLRLVVRFQMYHHFKIDAEMNDLPFPGTIGKHNLLSGPNWGITSSYRELFPTEVSDGTRVRCGMCMQKCHPSSIALGCNLDTIALSR